MKFLTYSNQTHGVEILYPMEWEILENFMGTVVSFLSPQESAKDDFRENLNVLVQDLTAQPMTIEDYTQLSLMQLEQVITKFKITDPISVSTLTGYPAHRLTYLQQQGKLKLKTTSVWTIIDLTAYVVSFATKRKEYDDYEPIFNEMIKSFKAL